MSNYPIGAEHDSNAPFNKEEKDGYTIGLFEYLENLEMPCEVRSELKRFKINLHEVKSFVKDHKKRKLLNEPQIFIEE
jgi:hypothetical protein